jgi:thiol-disulfide isomerase/thioredoxin
MAMFAQHNNKIIFDEMVNQSILYGEVNPEDFQNELFGLWYNEGFENYQPNAEVVDQIKPLLKNVTFELIVATWCPDSKRETPRFIKLLSKLDLAKSRYKMIAVNRKKVSPEAGVTEGYIDYVPTFIIRQNGNEIGRIVERPTETLERDLLAILDKD